MKIGCDIDDCLAEFMLTYLNRFGTPKKSSDITKNVTRILINDKEFWLNLPVLNTLDFIPELYCTKRINSKSWTKQWLKNNGFPDRPVYQMYYQHGNKADMIKGRVDVFIDDSVSNFIKMNLSGVPCLLYDKEYNKSWGPVGRIYNLKYDTIVSTYNEFMENYFNNFKFIVDEITRN